MSERPERVHLLNGRLVAEANLVLSPRDLGLLRGFGVFDFLITYHGGQPFHLSEHVERLYRSAAIIGLNLPWPAARVLQWAKEALAANSGWGGEHQIRLVATGGLSRDAMTPNREQPTLLVFVDPLVRFPASCYQRGASVVTDTFTRHLPQAKSLNYLQGVRRLSEARGTDPSVVEVVYYNERQVFEGATSNLFALIGGRLCTPKSDVLAGITRKVLLETLSLSEPVEMVDFSLEQLRAAREVFLTASNKEVMPVTRLDGRPVGSGEVGPVTRGVMAEFRTYVESKCWHA